MSFLLRKLKGAAVTAAVGAVTSYFMDPERGADRRRSAFDTIRRPVASIRSLRPGGSDDPHGDADPTGGAALAQVRSDAS